jgi:polysaccharide pyruvyl transferase WcaK-like protein
MQIALYDTSVGSPNLGDQIIMEAVERQVAQLFPDAFVFRLPTHDRIGKYGRRELRDADLVIAGGTNLLFSHWRRQRQWKLVWRDISAISRKLVLMGTGWTNYQSPPDWLARRAYRGLLSNTLIHSVRDGYSQRLLASAGFASLLNTGCPTLWALGEDKAHRAAGAGRRVITTLTDYRKDPARDREMLGTLLTHYKEVKLWTQGKGDLDYFKTLDVQGISLVSPSLQAFDDELSVEETDFAGTRLHAGIRALQKGCGSLIVSVDNRAREMGGDFGLPVLERGQIEGLTARLANPQPVRVRLPNDAISQWKGQFASYAPGAGE